MNEYEYMDMWCRYLRGFLYFTGINFLLTFVASILCVCFAPTAAGPGIPEIKAYLNGVDTPNMYGATTLFVKVSLLYVALSTSILLLLIHFHNHKEEYENLYIRIPLGYLDSFFGGLGKRVTKEQK